VYKLRQLLQPFGATGLHTYNGLKIKYLLLQANHGIIKCFNIFTSKSVMGMFNNLKAGKLQHKVSEKQSGIVL